jgi:putative PIN family toxin of toxin-antitoxin system
VRLVLDTVIVVAAIRSNLGASNRLLLAALDRRFTLLVSTPLLLEYEAVLTRPEHLAASDLAISDVQILLDAVTAVAAPVRLSFRWRPAVRDANDDMVFETAVNGQADAIVTFNQKDFAMTAKRFSLALLPPAEALSLLEKEV